MSFDTLGLSSSLLKAVEATGYTSPTPIQAQAVPAVLSGRDLMAAAQTGTGKTAGFTLPILQLLGGKPAPRSNHARALILTPTRELAAQIQESIETYGRNEKLRSAVVFGGVNINPQMKALRGGVDILVATPGRLLDLYQQNAVKFNDLEILVLDEADRMLDMGFIRDIRKILGLLPSRRQNLLFSATFSDEIRALAKTLCRDPQEIDVAPRNSTVEAISQKLYMVPKDRKADLLSQLLRATPDQTLVFSRTKHGANKLVKRLARDGISAAAIHGNKSQNQRTKALDDFKQNRVQVLVATDIAARGIDIDQLAQVINFDLPNVAEDYVHRIGRTGRAGATGLALSLVGEDESSQLKGIERLIKRRIERVDYALADVPKAPAAPEDEVRVRRSDARPEGRGRSGNASAQGGRRRRPEGDDTARGGKPRRGDSAAQGGRSRSGDSAAQGSRSRTGEGAVHGGRSRSGGDDTARRQSASGSEAVSQERRRSRNRRRPGGKSGAEAKAPAGSRNSQGPTLGDAAQDKSGGAAGGFWQSLRAGLSKLS